MTSRPSERPKPDRPSEPTCDQQDRRVAAEGKGRHGPAQRAWRGLPLSLLERLMGRVLVLKAFKPLSAAIAVPLAA